MAKVNSWILYSKKTVTQTKMVLGGLARYVRTKQYNEFEKFAQPSENSNVLDVGVSDSEKIEGTNLFERLYPYPESLTIASIEDDKKIKKLYPNAKVIKIFPNQKLPFKNGEFDIAVSWATLEHVGGYKKQAMFINELLRVGKKVFITTPYRACPYEPHTGFFLLHWLPLNLFRWFCIVFNNKFWVDEANLNPLYVKDVLKMRLEKKVKVRIFKMFGIIPSHLIITI